MIVKKVVKIFDFNWHIEFYTFNGKDCRGTNFYFQMIREDGLFTYPISRIIQLRSYQSKRITLKITDVRSQWNDIPISSVREGKRLILNYLLNEQTIS